MIIEKNKLRACRDLSRHQRKKDDCMPCPLRRACLMIIALAHLLTSRRTKEMMQPLSATPCMSHDHLFTCLPSRGTKEMIASPGRYCMSHDHREKDDWIPLSTTPCMSYDHRFDPPADLSANQRDDASPVLYATAPCMSRDNLFDAVSLRRDNRKVDMQKLTIIYHGTGAGARHQRDDDPTHSSPAWQSLSERGTKEMMIQPTSHPAWQSLRVCGPCHLFGCAS